VPSSATPTAQRRDLAADWLGNDGMRADDIPCDGTAANCRPGIGKPANKYTRGCTFLQRCARNIN
jgi:hypothetical protein